MRRSICDFVGLIQQSRGTDIYRRVVRKANSDMSRSSQGLLIFMEGKSIHSEIVKLEERQTVNYGKSDRSSQGISCFQIYSHLVGLSPYIKEYTGLHLHSFHVLAVSRIRR